MHGIAELLEVQIELANRLPFCYAAFLGTHNSGITIADGYGNLDARFQQYFKWIRWVVRALYNSRCRVMYHGDCRSKRLITHEP